MTLHLTIPAEDNFFQPSPIRRAHTQPEFVDSYTSSFSRSPRKASFELTSPSEPAGLGFNFDRPPLPLASEPADDFSFAQFDEAEDQILFPSYDDENLDLSAQDEEDLEAPPSPRTGDSGDSYSVSPTTSASTDPSRPESPETVDLEFADDDTAIESQPTRHVDYLSHTWKEEDIWASWRHIISRRSAYQNSERLENASWRTWMKAKNNLKTISPETLNWMKDCDVTWLYGPLQIGKEAPSITLSSPSPSNGDQMSKSTSPNPRKPILKKRSMSEVMLQRSLSSSSLVKQAAAAVQAQQSGSRATPSRGAADFAAFPFEPRCLTRENSINVSGLASDVSSTPFEEKHIHFNPHVEQRIALEIKGDDDEADVFVPEDEDDSDSEDGLMMKKSDSKRKLPPLGKKAAEKKPCFNDTQTIAPLPPTTLKHREESSDKDSAVKHSNGIWKAGRGSSPSNGYSVGQYDDDDDEDWEPPVNRFMGRRDSVAVTQNRFHGLQRVESDESLTGEPSAGMRRTASGMFMPYSDDDEDDMVSEGLFGKVVDTVNTAKDIAHVIWNVGWRR